MHFFRHSHNGNIYHSGGGETYIGSNIKGINLEHIAKEFIDAGFETIVSDDIPLAKISEKSVLNGI